MSARMIHSHNLSHTHIMDEICTGTIASLRNLDPNANHARRPKTKENSHRADLRHTNKIQSQNVQKKHNSEINLASLASHFNVFQPIPKLWELPK